MIKYYRRLIAGTILISWLLVGLTGCAALGGVKSEIQGSYYLSNGDYQGGVQALSAEVNVNPDDAAAQYYLGRCLLALDNPAEALPHLERAVRLAPGSAEYHFWQGVAYWGVMDFRQERSSYLKAIELDRDYLPAHLYLGHNYLDANQAAKALKEYDLVLSRDPRNPDALHNRAQSLKALGRSREEIAAWKTYLDYYPDGSLARAAADHINEKGDFSYRNQVIGVRPMTVEWIRFEPKTDIITRESEPTLRAVGAVLANNKHVKLEIHSFYKNNQQLAQGRGQRVKEFLVNQYQLDPGRLTVRAYGRAERILEGKKIFYLDHSVVFQNRGR